MREVGVMVVPAAAVGLWLQGFVCPSARNGTDGSPGARDRDRAVRALQLERSTFRVCACVIYFYQYKPILMIREETAGAATLPGGALCAVFVWPTVYNSILYMAFGSVSA